MVMPVVVDDTFPLIQQIHHEGMSLEVYRINKDTVRADLRINGKSVMNDVFTRPHNNYRSYTQKAFDNVFYWHSSVNFQSPDERANMLATLRAYWGTLTDRTLNPSPSMVSEFDIGEHHVKLARHWHPNRFVVRIYCSLVISGNPVSVYPDFIMETERKYSVACELSANQRPPAEHEVVAALLAQLQ